MTSKHKAILSGIVFLLGLFSFNLAGVGLLPVLVTVVAFFTMLFQAGMHLTGNKQGDALDSYQSMNKTKASALKQGLDNSKESD